LLSCKITLIKMLILAEFRIHHNIHKNFIITDMKFIMIFKF